MAGNNNQKQRAYPYYLDNLRREALSCPLSSRGKSTLTRIILRGEDHNNGMPSDDLIIYLNNLIKDKLIESFDVEYTFVGFDPFLYSEPEDCPPSYYDLVIKYRPDAFVIKTVSGINYAPQEIKMNGKYVWISMKNGMRANICLGSSRHGRLLLALKYKKDELNFDETIGHLYETISKDKFLQDPKEKYNKVSDAVKQLNRCLENRSIKDSKVKIEMIDKHFTENSRVSIWWERTH